MKKPTLNKRRNPVAHSVLLRKGGVHQKSKTSERTRAKAGIRRALNDWKGGRGGPADSYSPATVILSISNEPI